MLVGEGQTWHWVRLDQWEHPKRDFKNPKPLILRKMLENSLEISTEQFQYPFLRLLIRTKFRSAHKSLTNLFMTIGINFRLF